jgi:peptide/nickel transport system substrate-binding protein
MKEHSCFVVRKQECSLSWICKKGTCLLPEFVAAYEAKKTAGSYEAYNAAMKELQALADEQVVGLALCWDKAYFPYRTDHYEGWTNFPGWGVINYKTWFSTRPAV